MSTNIFIEIPEELDFLRKFPKLGSWAMLVGSSVGLRPVSIPHFCKDINLRRMDIFWVENEQMAESDLKKVEKKFMYRGSYSKSIELKKEQEIIKNFLGMDGFTGITSDIQNTIVDACIGGSQTVRFYCGELNVMSEEKINDMMDAYKIKSIDMIQDSIEENPILEETVRDIMGALMLDGLSKQESLLKVVEWNELETNTAKKMFKKPNHYFKIIDDYYFAFNRN